MAAPSVGLFNARFINRLRKSLKGLKIGMSQDALNKHESQLP